MTKPKLHTYKTYGMSFSGTDDSTYQETLTETNNVFFITNCAVVGDVIATSSYVGGILGKGVAGEYMTSTENTAYCTRYYSNHNSINSTYKYLYYCDGTYNIVNGSTGNNGAPPFTYYTYTYSSVKTSVTDNYLSGNLKGTDYVGGVVGYLHGGIISRNYSYAAIEGSNKVGGIVGYMLADLQNITTTLSSNVTLNSTVSATSQVGKVYGHIDGSYLTVATSGNSINLTLNTTRLVVEGITQQTSNDAQNGTLRNRQNLLRSETYAGLGWNFDVGAEWTSEETVTYPYKRWQTAPPTIASGAVKGSTTLSGNCPDNSTVYVSIEGNSTVYEATCSDGSWSLTVPELKSGLLIRAWSKNADKEQSFHTSTIVSPLGSGTEANPWLVYDAYDLRSVNKPGYYKQMNDISLTSWISANSPSKGWVPVGINNTDPVYYDGDNHKVTGLWTNTTENNIGLFSSFSGTICNLTVQATSKQVKGGNYTGMVIGRMEEGTIENVNAIGNVSGGDNVGVVMGKMGIGTLENVTANGNVSGGTSVGGIVGYTNLPTFNRLSYTGRLTATGRVGGIVGWMNAGGSITECEAMNIVITYNPDGADYKHVGGLVGGSYGGGDAFNKCKVTGTITSTSTSYNIIIGGLTGYSQGTFTECSTDVNISNASGGMTAGLVAKNDGGTVRLCSSAGTITSTGANSHTGGLVADNHGSIENCYSTANVIGTGYVGGIAGYAAGPISNSYATGSLHNTSDDGRAGGIVGYIEGSAAVIKGCGGLNKRIETGSNQWGFRIIGGTGSDITRPEITDNYGWDQMPILRNNATKTVYDDPYEGTAKTTAQLQQQSTYEALGWDFTDVWTMTADGFPELQWLASSVMKGDLNGDGEVSITDVVLIIDVIAEVITDANQVAAADVNNDGEVTITDCVAAIDLIAEQQSSGARRATDNGQRSMSNVQWSTTDFISASMQDKMLNVCLDNERSYTAFQMVVTMPEGMTLTRATMDSERGGDHQVTLRDLGNGQYLVAGFSMDNDKLAGNSGRLLSIVTDGQASGSIVISNVEFATAQAEGYRLKDAMASSMTTGVSEMVNSESSNSKYYDLQGRRVAAPAKGLYIVNGKKINLK